MPSGRQGAPPVFVTPGCTYDPRTVPEANLQAIRKAVIAAT